MCAQDTLPFLSVFYVLLSVDLGEVALVQFPIGGHLESAGRYCASRRAYDGCGISDSPLVLYSLPSCLGPSCPLHIQCWYFASLPSSFFVFPVLKLLQGLLLMDYRMLVSLKGKSEFSVHERNYFTCKCKTISA